MEGNIMNDLKNNVKNTKDQVVGRVKEKIGDITNNEELELKGKIQSTTADAKKNVAEIREKTAKKLNDFFDNKEDDKANK
jgi:uncharacterized protein YjbJ (UPF0337 family)